MSFHPEKDRMDPAKAKIPPPLLRNSRAGDEELVQIHMNDDDGSNVHTELVIPKDVADKDAYVESVLEKRRAVMRKLMPEEEEEGDKWPIALSLPRMAVYADSLIDVDSSEFNTLDKVTADFGNAYLHYLRKLKGGDYANQFVRFFVGRTGWLLDKPSGGKRFRPTLVWAPFSTIAHRKKLLGGQKVGAYLDAAATNVGKLLHDGILKPVPEPLIQLLENMQSRERVLAYAKGLYSREFALELRSPELDERTLAKFDDDDDDDEKEEGAEAEAVVQKTSTPAVVVETAAAAAATTTTTTKEEEEKDDDDDDDEKMVAAANDEKKKKKKKEKAATETQEEEGNVLHDDEKMSSKSFAERLNGVDKAKPPKKAAAAADNNEAAAADNENKVAPEAYAAAVEVAAAELDRQLKEFISVPQRVRRAVQLAKRRHRKAAAAAAAAAEDSDDDDDDDNDDDDNNNNKEAVVDLVAANANVENGVVKPHPRLHRVGITDITGLHTISGESYFIHKFQVRVTGSPHATTLFAHRSQNRTPKWSNDMLGRLKKKFDHPRKFSLVDLRLVERQHAPAAASVAQQQTANDDDDNDDDDSGEAESEQKTAAAPVEEFPINVCVAMPLVTCEDIYQKKTTTTTSSSDATAPKKKKKTTPSHGKVEEVVKKRKHGDDDDDNGDDEEEGKKKKTKKAIKKQKQQHLVDFVIPSSDDDDNTVAKKKQKTKKATAVVDKKRKRDESSDDDSSDEDDDDSSNMIMMQMMEMMKKMAEKKKTAKKKKPTTTHDAKKKKKHVADSSSSE